jgi:hypothetical protein
VATCPAPHRASAPPRPVAAPTPEWSAAPETSTAEACERRDRSPGDHGPGRSLPAAPSCVVAHLVAHLTRDAESNAAAGRLGDQLSDPLGGRHRTVLRDGWTRRTSAQVRPRSRRGRPRTYVGATETFFRDSRKATPLRLSRFGATDLNGAVLLAFGNYVIRHLPCISDRCASGEAFGAQRN